jgi:hypothetical protein
VASVGAPEFFPGAPTVQPKVKLVLSPIRLNRVHRFAPNRGIAFFAWGAFYLYLMNMGLHKKNLCISDGQ